MSKIDSKEYAEREKTLKRLAEADPEIKEALIKVEAALMEEFKRRPWEHMDLLEMDPEIVEALTKREPRMGWVYVYVVVCVGIAMVIIGGDEWGRFYWHCWLIIGMAIFGVYCGLWTAINH